MTGAIEQGFMVFLADGREGIGAVRQVLKASLLIYVENAGEFDVPMSTITGVHSQKVMLDPKLLSKDVLKAIARAHDREDPKLLG